MRSHSIGDAHIQTVILDQQQYDEKRIPAELLLASADVLDSEASAESQASQKHVSGELLLASSAEASSGASDTQLVLALDSADMLPELF